MNSSRSFNCSTTCVGMHADVQWHEYKIEDEMEDRYDDTYDIVEDKHDDREDGM